jgi:hypothetical protein
MVKDLGKYGDTHSTIRWNPIVKQQVDFRSVWMGEEMI